MSLRNARCNDKDVFLSVFSIAEHTGAPSDYPLPEDGSTLDRLHRSVNIHGHYFI